MLLIFFYDKTYHIIGMVWVPWNLVHSRFTSQNDVSRIAIEVHFLLSRDSKINLNVNIYNMEKQLDTKSTDY